MCYSCMICANMSEVDSKSKYMVKIKWLWCPQYQKVMSFNMVAPITDGGQGKGGGVMCAVPLTLFWCLWNQMIGKYQ